MWVTESTADYQAVIVDTCGIFREKALTGCEHTSAKEPPLTAVRVAREGEVDLC